LPALKAANPGLKALVYKNLSFTDSYGCSNGVDQARLSTGVGYCDADHNHPDWFLTDSSGGRLNSYYFPHAWTMDVGSPAYQSKWLSNVLADVRAGGWDGVFMDDTNTDMSWHLHGRTIAKYPTSASWRAATRSMLANVGPALTSAGFLAVPNLSDPWAVPGRECVAPELHRRDRARESVLIDGDGLAREALSARRRNDDDFGHARSDDRGDPPLDLDERTSAPTSRGDHAEGDRLGHDGVAGLERADLNAGRRLPKQPAGRDRRQQRLLRRHAPEER